MAPALEWLEPRLLLTTYAVTTAADSGPGSLRDAIAAANASPGPDAITFALAGPGPFTISPASPLPAVTDTLSIDGTTQSGFDPATEAPVVVLDGSAAGASARGLTLSGGGADGSTVRGLQVVSFTGDDVRLDGASHCVVAGNYLGTDGTRALGGPGSGPPGNAGVFLSDGASYNRIGGPARADRNVASGGNQDGIEIAGGGISYNVIEGNYLGTDATGTRPLGNLGAGIQVFNDAGSSPPDVGNVIGGTGGGEGNLISANGIGSNLYFRAGIYIEAADNVGQSITGTLIAGNLIGTDASGAAALPNGKGGVNVYAAATTVGGTSPAARNVIADGMSLAGTAPSSRAITSGPTPPAPARWAAVTA